MTVAPRHPDQIMEDFDRGCRGLSDIDMKGVLWEVIEDLLASVKLACESHDADPKFVTMDSIYTTVVDYATNSYGDD